MKGNLFFTTLLTLWIVTTPWCQKSHFTETDIINQIDISPDGSMVATSGVSKKMTVWNFSNLNPIYTLSLPKNVLTSKFSKDQKYIAVGQQYNDTVSIVSTSTFTVIKQIVTPFTTIRQVDFSWDNERLIICGNNGYQLYWVGNWTKEWYMGFLASVNACRFQKDNRIVVGDNSGKTSVLFTGTNNSLQWAFAPMLANIRSVDIDSTSSIIITTYASAAYHIYPSRKSGTTQPILLTNILGSSTNHVSFSKDGLIYAVSTYNFILIYENGTNKLLFNWTNGAYSGVFSYDNQYYISGGSNGMIKIFKQNCQSCPVGTYQYSNRCLLCAESMVGCLSCTNSSFCSACRYGYTVDIVNKNCTLCTKTMEGCVQCNSTSICLACSLTHFLFDSFCHSCHNISNCITCTSPSVCSSCNGDYYVDTTFKCSPCTLIKGCLTCLNSTACVGCFRGYYLNSTSLSCTKCLDNCEQCSTSNDCSKCMQGYSYISGINKCQGCQTNCLKCNSISSCSVCTTSYYLNGSSCKPCPHSCLQCSFISSCSSCISGYYLDSGLCIPCTNNCLTCNASTFCLSCKINYFIASAGICSKCGGGCSTCNSQACFSCLSSYYLFAGTCIPCPQNCPKCLSNSSCLNCKKGFYISSTQNCQQCNSAIPNCATCASNSVCTSCELGYYIKQAISQCIKCSWPCSKCNETQCFSCAIGHYLDSEKCFLCPQNCSSCISANLCSSCIKGFYLSSTKVCISCFTVSSGCQTCNQTNCISCIITLGYYLNTSTSLCSSCSIISNCLKCINSNLCTTCISGYYLSNSTCSLCSNLVSNCHHCNSTVCLSCLDPYHITSSGCQLCSEGCSSCYNSSNCKVCFYGYLLQMGVCNFCNSVIKGCQFCISTTLCQQCQEGYILSGNRCVECGLLISGCLFCNNTNLCLSCIDQYYLSSTNNCTRCSTGCSKCISSSICMECLSGYYRNSSNLCSPCNDKMCLQCSDSNYCHNCLSGYFSNSTGMCQQCNLMFKGCILCTSSICIQCVSGFYLNSLGECSQCLTTGCQICNIFNSSQCVTCSSNYYLSPLMSCQSCTLSIQGCLNCISPSYCTTCLSGYYLAGNFSCQPCLRQFKGCRQCLMNGCRSCQGGYLLNASICVSCFELISGCQYCISSTVCLSCQSGYYTLGNLCLTCSNLNGCIDCSNSTSCNLCSDSYYLNSVDELCYSCSSAMVGCVTCSSASICKSCLGNYALNGGACSQIQGSVATKPYKELRMITQYVNDNTLKHRLIVKGSCFKRSSSVNLIISSTIIMVSVRSSQQLTIEAFQWAENSCQIIFYTNNPLGPQLLSQFRPLALHRLLQFNQQLFDEGDDRLLQSTNVNLNYQFQLNMAQPAIQTILPSSSHSGSLSLKSSTKDPSFIRSLYNQKQYNYHYMGLIITAVMFIIYFLKATVTLPKSDDQGQIVSHVFLLRCGGFIFNLAYLEYIDYCYGFLSADLYWLNSLTSSMAENSDLSPNSYLLFYPNMTLASTYLSALFLVTTICLILVLVYWMFPSAHQSVKSIGIFFYNFFEVGLIIAGSASIQGAYYNNQQQLTKNSIYYICGIVIHVIVGIINILLVLNNNYRINKIRVFIKTSFLSIIYISPLYLLPTTMGIELIFIFLQFKVKKAIKIHPRLWLANQFLLNLSFILLVTLSNSLFSIVLSFSLAVLAVLIDLFIHISEFRQQQFIGEMKEIQKIANTFKKQEKLNKSIKQKNNAIYQKNNSKKHFTTISLMHNLQNNQSNQILNSDMFLLDEPKQQIGKTFTLEDQLQFEEY